MVSKTMGFSAVNWARKGSIPTEPIVHQRQTSGEAVWVSIHPHSSRLKFIMSTETPIDVLHENGVAYALDRSYTASGRLALQHQLWKEVTVKPISPRILAHLKSPKGGSAGAAVEVNIADVGTGTGIWAVDIARGLSTQEVKFKVHGFDISDEQFPPAHALPAGVQLSVADALAAPAEYLCGTFDLVHIAHFAGVRALGEDPSPAMDHAMALLKPGGWIQWDEWAQDGKGKIEILSQGPSPRCDAALVLTAKVLPKLSLDALPPCLLFVLRVF
ncbi:hypothetical protein B0H67DRAFT_149115 [Lasiosphaeris hirsuta]|uniref:Methyltransferase domain-containing protein n=1 Tax=Lasiosphaeris hirsuta TaxID=260670 RepID=A0AA40ANY1_9PEZI|nr:hypothetical protein B0H67DRAFT_149115 [Lasiosphaeris hirsuta]